MQKNRFGLKRVFALSTCGFMFVLTASAQSVATTITESPGSFARDTTVTGANGKTATYQNNASWGNGSYTDTQRVTGVNGKSATSTTTASYARKYDATDHSHRFQRPNIQL